LHINRKVGENKYNSENAEEYLKWIGMIEQGAQNLEK